MKKVSCPTAITVLCVIGFTLIIAALIFCIVLGIEGLVNNQTNEVGVYFSLAGVYILFLVFLCFAIDESAYTVYYDSVNKVLIKKGLFGIKSKIKIESIKTIVIETLFRVGPYFIILGSYEETRKKFSLIELYKTESSEEFIRQFWYGPIEDNSEKRFLY